VDNRTNNVGKFMQLKFEQWQDTNTTCCEM